MQKKTFRTVGGATAVAGTAVAALGIGTIVGALLRDAFGADRASDDGPDDLLAPADHHESGRHRVTTPDGTTLNVVHYGTDDPEDPDADIVVAAAGVPGIITADMVKPGAAVLDVGVSRIVAEDGTSKVAGDVAADVAEVAGWVSPNPGGVGPMTRAMLLTNVVEAAERGLA